MSSPMSPNAMPRVLRVLKELAPNDMSAIHRDRLAKRADLTGDWFIETKLDPWYVSAKKNLWAYGDPGTGKTTLLAHTVDNLERRAKKTRGMSVCYCYCDHVNKKATVAEVLTVLLRQHIEQDGDPSSVEEVVIALNRHKRGNVSGLSQSEVETLLKTIVGRRSTFYLLDALDQLPSDLRVPLIRSLSSLGARLIITSRVDERVEKEFRVGTTFCEVRARDVDVDRLLDVRIADSLELEDVIGESHLRDEISRTIKANCNGMFLHAALQIDALRGCTTIEAVRKALKDFSSTIDHFYGASVKRMMGQLETVDTAKMGLTCLLTAFGPITVQDLQYLLAFDQNAPSPFPTECVLPKDTLLSLFCGLVSVDEETQIVDFIHITAREFLMEQMKSDPIFERRHDILSRACIARLKSLDMHCSTIGSRAEYERAMSDKPLLGYAHASWARHTHKSTEPATRENALNFIDQCTSYPVRYGEAVDHHLAIHIAAQHGFLETIQAARPHVLCACTSNSQSTPLMLASSNGHRDVVFAILSHLDAPGLLVNQVDKYGGTALMDASSAGHADIVRLLLGVAEILVNQADKFRGTALMYAGQHADVVRLLLDAPGILVNQADRYGRTALMNASSAGHADIVRLLLGAPEILVNQADRFGGTALMAASSAGQTDIVRLLLGAPGILVNQATQNGRTALINASSAGRTDIVRLLLDAPGILVNQATQNGYTALMDALLAGHADVVQLLLDAPGILVNQAVQHAMIILMDASSGGNADGDRQPISTQEPAPVVEDAEPASSLPDVHLSNSSTNLRAGGSDQLLTKSDPHH